MVVNKIFVSSVVSQSILQTAVYDVLIVTFTVFAVRIQKVHIIKNDDGADFFEYTKFWYSSSVKTLL